jgi:hypothetical protein
VADDVDLGRAGGGQDLVDLAWISEAVMVLDWLVLYDQLFSSAVVQPSAWKRPIIVVQVELLEFQPWTKRIGSWTRARAAGGVIVDGNRSRDRRAKRPVTFFMVSPHLVRCSRGL